MSSPGVHRHFSTPKFDKEPKKDGKEMDLSFFHSLYFLPFEHTKTPNRAAGACLLPIMILPDEPGYHGRFS